MTDHSSPLTQRFARRITRGLWIVPKRRNEAVREILEHLEDLAQEHRIEEWTPQLLELHFGREKDLRRIYRIWGVSRKAKAAKYLVLSANTVLLLMLSMNLYTLFLYPIPSEYLEKIRLRTSIHPYSESSRFFNQTGYLWLTEQDAEARELLRKIDACKAIYENGVQKAREQALQKIDLQSLKEKYPRLFKSNRKGIVDSLQVGSSPKRKMEDLVREDRERLLIHVSEMSVSPQLTDEESAALLQLWLSIPKDASLRFVRPEVQGEDIEMVEEMFSNPDFHDWIETLPRELEIPGLHTAYSWAHESQKKRLSVSLPEIIQTAKEHEAATEYGETMDWIFRDMSRKWLERDSSPPFAAQLAQAHVRWCAAHLRSFHPYPEHANDIFLIAFGLQTAQEILRAHMKNLKDIDGFANALAEFQEVRILPLVMTFEEMKRVDHKQMEMEQEEMDGPGDQVALRTAANPLFQIECSLLLRWYPRESKRALALEALRKLPTLPLVHPSSLNHDTYINRLKTLEAYQRMARLIRDSYPRSAESGLLDPEELTKAAAQIRNPFDEKPLRLEIQDNELTLVSTGPTHLTKMDQAYRYVYQGDIRWPIQVRNE